VFVVDVGVPLDAVVVVFFFEVGPASADFALVFGALVSALANFASPFAGFVDVPLATVECEPFDVPVETLACVPFGALKVEPFVCVPVIFIVEPFAVGPLGAVALGAPPFGAWVLLIVGLGALFGFVVFGPASAPTPTERWASSSRSS